MSNRLTVEQVRAALTECNMELDRPSRITLLTDSLNWQLEHATEEATTDILVRCVGCKRDYYIRVPVEGFKKWTQDRTLIQVAMPNLSPDERELLISQTCGECYDKLFA